MALQVAPGALGVVQLRGGPRQRSTLSRAARQAPPGSPRSCRSGRCPRPGPPADLGAGRRTVLAVEPRRQGSEVAGALGRGGEDDRLAPWRACAPSAPRRERAPPCPPRRLDPQVGAAPGPALGQVGVGQCLLLVPEQRWMSPAAANCFSSRSPRPARSTASASCRPSSVCRGRRQRPPFLSATFRRPGEIVSPVRAATSRASRARVRPGRSAAGAPRPSRATACVASRSRGVRPVRGRGGQRREPAGADRRAPAPHLPGRDVQPRRDRAAGLAVGRPQHRPRPVRLATRCRAAQRLQLGATRLRPPPTRPTAPLPSMPRSDVAPCAFISRAALSGPPVLGVEVQARERLLQPPAGERPACRLRGWRKPRGRARTAPR